MALPTTLRNALLPPELEFIASEELVDIRPTVRMDRIRFISVSSLVNIGKNWDTEWPLS